MFAVVAAARFAEQGRAVPASLAPLRPRFEFLSGVYHESIRPYVRALKALSVEEVLAMAERSLGEEYTYARGLGALLAWPDDAMLGRFFDKDTANGFLEPEVVGRFGARRAAAPGPHLGAHAARASAHPAPAGARRPRRRGRPGRGRRPLVGLPRGSFDEEGVERLKYWTPRTRG